MTHHASKLKIVIVDDHPGVRAGIKFLLNPVEDMTVIGEGANGAEALELVKEKRPDILLLDVELPVIRGEEVARRVRDRYPEVKVLALSSYNDRQYIRGMMKNGASGYITKDEAPAMLINAIRSVYQGEKLWISPRAEIQAQPLIPDKKTFTGRELEILEYLVLGKSDLEISRALGISEEILGGYFRLLQMKFGVDTRETLEQAAREV